LNWKKKDLEGLKREGRRQLEAAETVAKQRKNKVVGERDYLLSGLVR